MDAITAVDELKRLVVVPILVLSTRGVCVRDRRVMSQGGWGGSAGVSVSREAGRKVEGGRYSDGGYRGGVAMVTFSINCVVVRDIAR